MEDLTPKEIVQELDRYIIGQEQAKKAVAIALRNRYRRKHLPQELRDEVVPKNIIMIGPTGVGKTEIARRLARLVRAPFIKVEATKFTEVGYVGRDVESIIRDLVEVSIRMIKTEKMIEVEDRAKKMVEERILDILFPLSKKEKTAPNPFEFFFGSTRENKDRLQVENEQSENYRQSQLEREKLLQNLRDGKLEDRYIEIEVDDHAPPMLEVFGGSGMEEMGINLQDMLGGFLPKKRKKRKVTIADARKVLLQEEAQKLIDMDEVIAIAVERAEQSGIVFLDEIDKIAGQEKGYGPDVSRGGVQRDILPIVEGSTVMTKYGPVKTDHILFIAAGAFHVSKPSDLIPELQGRFPIRVELNNLSKEDFMKILTEPQNSLIRQYTALLRTEGINVEFTESAIDELAEISYTVNAQTENIGARRLHTILEKVLEDISFNAIELAKENPNFVIDRDYVRDKLFSIVKNEDLSRYIL